MIVINRLILNLNQVGHRGDNDDSIGTISTGPVFATNTILGNIGAPLKNDYEDSESSIEFEETEMAGIQSSDDQDAW